MQNLHTYKKGLQGMRLPTTNLSELIASEQLVMLHFLRHLGCIYCKNTVSELALLKSKFKKFPAIYFVHQSKVDEGEVFFQKYFPDAAHISDPTMEIYNLFEIKGLKPQNYFNPWMWLKGIKLLIKGHRNSIQPDSNILVLSGTFLFKNGTLAWSHRAKYAGDDPAWHKLIYGSGGK